LSGTGNGHDKIRISHPR